MNYYKNILQNLKENNITNILTNDIDAWELNKI